MDPGDPGRPTRDAELPRIHNTDRLPGSDTFGGFWCRWTRRRMNGEQSLQLYHFTFRSALQSDSNRNTISPTRDRPNATEHNATNCLWLPVESIRGSHLGRSLKASSFHAASEFRAKPSSPAATPNCSCRDYLERPWHRTWCLSSRLHRSLGHPEQ